MRFSHAHLGITILSGLWLSACTEQIEPAIGEGVAPSFGLPAFFDCMDESGHTLISAHRGGPERGYPENSMAAFKRTTSHTHALLEVDVSTSADGVLFLHHDDTLDRTTTGSGLASETKWEKLKTLSLKDPDHRVTAYGLTRLDDTLDWANGRAILQLDIKRGTDFDDVARIVRDAGAEERIVLIAYTPGQAYALAKRFPQSMISVPVENLRDLEIYEGKNIPRRQLLAWTGNKKTNPGLYKNLDEKGVEVIFGTLGGRSSIDKDIANEEDDQRYNDIVSKGVDILATDRPLAAYAALLDVSTEPDIKSCFP